MKLLLLAFIFLFLPTQSSSVRLVFAGLYTLSPINPDTSNCVDASLASCLSGWARANAFFRQMRRQSQQDDFVLINSVDGRSRLVLFHPQSIQLNQIFATRSNSSVVIYQETSLLNSAELWGTTVLLTSTPVTTPILSNLPPTSVITAQLSRSFAIINTGSLRVLLYNMLFSSRSVFVVWSEHSTVLNSLHWIRRSQNIDVVVVKLFDRDSVVDWSDRFTDLGVDIVVGPCNNNKTTSFLRNNTFFVLQQNLDRNSVNHLVIDWDVQRRTLPTIQEFPVTKEILPAWRDQEYLDDVQYLQAYLDAAAKSDPPIGVSASVFPEGRPCRMFECEQGNFWTHVLHQAFPDANAAVFNAGALRSGWKPGNITQGTLYDSMPYQAQPCLFTMQGVDFWAMLNNSVSKVPQTANTTVGFSDTGRFLVMDGVRLVYNPNITNRIISVDIWNPQTQAFSPLSHRAFYKIVSTNFICEGGDGYAPVMSSALNVTVSSLVVQTEATKFVYDLNQQPLTAVLDGRTIRSLNRFDSVVLAPKVQSDCPPQTYFLPEYRDCEPCQLDFYQPLSGQLACVPVTSSSSFDWGIVGAIIVGVVFVVALPFIWRLTANHRRMAKLLNNDRVATELAESVASMDFDAVQFLEDIEHPTRIQLAFLRIVRVLREYRTFIPAAVFTDGAGLEDLSLNVEEPDTLKTEIPSEVSSDSMLSLRSLNRSNNIPEDPRVLQLRNMGCYRKFNSTLLCVSTELSHNISTPRQLHEQSQTLIENVLLTIESNGGVAVNIAADYIVCAWNAFKPWAQPEKASCTAGLRLVEQQGIAKNTKLHVCVAGGPLFVGFVGTLTLRSPIVFGGAAESLMNLKHYGRTVEAALLNVTEFVAKKIEENFCVALVDVVSYGSKKTEKVFEVTESNWKVPESYKAAFAQLINHRFQNALNLFETFFESENLNHIPIPRVIVDHSIRLAKLCQCGISESKVISLIRVGCTMRNELDVQAKYLGPTDTLPLGIREYAPKSPLKSPFRKKRSFDDSGGAIPLDGSFRSDNSPATPNEGIISPVHEDNIRDIVQSARAGGGPNLKAAVFGDSFTANKVTYRQSRKILGRGATSEVCLGMSEQDGGLVALKFMNLPDKDQEEEALSPSTNRRRKMKKPQRDAVEAIIHEIDLLQSLRHDHIVSYLGANVVGNKLVIITEYVSGGSLQSLIEAFGKIPIPSVKRFLGDTLHGLQYLHSKNIVHRDIKPHNVLLMTDGECKLTDFGASAMIGDSEENTVTGTPLYMAPEACKGAATFASDIWSIGVMALELILGRTPWTKTQLGEPFIVPSFIYRLGREDSMVPLESLDGVPAEAVDFLTQCLRRDPSARLSAEELLTHSFLL